MYFSETKERKIKFGLHNRENKLENVNFTNNCLKFQRHFSLKRALDNIFILKFFLAKFHLSDKD